MITDGVAAYSTFLRLMQREPENKIEDDHSDEDLEQDQMIVQKKEESKEENQSISKMTLNEEMNVQEQQPQFESSSLRLTPLWSMLNEYRETESKELRNSNSTLFQSLVQKTNLEEVILFSYF